MQKILKIKHEMENLGHDEFPEDTKFIKIFDELKKWFKKWFKWYDHYNGKSFMILFKENYDLVVFTAMIGIQEGVTLYDNTKTKTKFSKREIIIDIINREFYKYNQEFYINHSNVYGIEVVFLGNFINDIIHDKMNIKCDDDAAFEKFLKEYFAILEKYNNDVIVETIDTPVAPTYKINNKNLNNKINDKNPNEAIVDQYGYIPKAYLALQRNPVGIWYMYQKTGKYRSQFVDYRRLDKSSDNMALNHIEAITKLMTKCTVYQMILQEMPELGNKIKFKIAGYNASKIELLAMKDDAHVLAIIYDAAEDKAQGISGDKKNVDTWTAKKLAD